MIDRFGPLPNEVENLIQVIRIKQFCRRAGVAKLDAGAKGAVITFHNQTFADPAGLINFIQQDAGKISLRPDHRLVVRRDWMSEQNRIQGSRHLVESLADIVEKNH